MTAIYFDAQSLTAAATKALGGPSHCVLLVVSKADLQALLCSEAKTLP